MRYAPYHVDILHIRYPDTPTISPALLAKKQNSSKCLDAVSKFVSFMYRIVSYCIILISFIYHNTRWSNDTYMIHTWYASDTNQDMHGHISQAHTIRTIRYTHDTHTIHTQYTPYHNDHRSLMIQARYAHDTNPAQRPPHKHPKSTPKVRDMCTIWKAWYDLIKGRSDMIPNVIPSKIWRDMSHDTHHTPSEVDASDTHVIQFDMYMICVWYMRYALDVMSGTCSQKFPQKLWQNYPQNLDKNTFMCHVRIICVSCVYHVYIIGIITHIWKYISQTCCPWSERICVVS